MDGDVEGHADSDGERDGAVDALAQRDADSDAVLDRDALAQRDEERVMLGEPVALGTLEVDSESVGDTDAEGLREEDVVADGDTVGRLDAPTDERPVLLADARRVTSVAEGERLTLGEPLGVMEDDGERDELRVTLGDVEYENRDAVRDALTHGDKVAVTDGGFDSDGLPDADTVELDRPEAVTAVDGDAVRQGDTEVLGLWEGLRERDGERV